MAFIIDDILLSPLKFTVWIGKKLGESAYQEMTDESKIHEELLQLQMRYEVGGDRRRRVWKRRSQVDGAVGGHQKNEGGGNIAMPMIAAGKGAFRCPRCGEITSGSMRSCPEVWAEITWNVPTAGRPGVISMSINFVPIAENDLWNWQTEDSKQENPMYSIKSNR